MNINTAINQANRNSRALNMKSEGYYYLSTDWIKAEVFKPGNFNMIPDYIVDRVAGTCTCKDAEKGNTCKHRLFVELQMNDYPQAAEMLKAAIEEKAMWDEVCEKWEEETANA